MLHDKRTHGSLQRRFDKVKKEFSPAGMTPRGSARLLLHHVGPT
jgi:hypothetical protein